MRLFRKHHTPAEVGAIVYETLRSSLAAASGPLTIGHLLGLLGRAEGNMPEMHVGEIVCGAMFAASIALERSVPRWMAAEILRGMRDELSRHLHEQGAADDQVAEWERILDARSAAYRESLADYDGLEPPWKLGRAFLWNVTGERLYNALAIKHATHYILALRDRAQEAINAYGPTIEVFPSGRPPEVPGRN